MKKYNTQEELEKEIKKSGYPDYIRGEWNGPGYYTYETTSEYFRGGRYDSVSTFYTPENKVAKLKEEIKEKLDELDYASLHLKEKYNIYSEFDWGGGDKDVKWLQLDNCFEYLWDDEQSFASAFTKEDAESIVKSFSEVGTDLKIKLKE